MWENLRGHGLLIAGGAFNPPSGAMFILRAPNASDIEAHVKKVCFKNLIL